MGGCITFSLLLPFYQFFCRTFYHHYFVDRLNHTLRCASFTIFIICRLFRVCATWNVYKVVIGNRGPYFAYPIPVYFHTELNMNRMGGK